jgi:putative membrane protein
VKSIVGASRIFGGTGPPACRLRDAADRAFAARQSRTARERPPGTIAAKRCPSKEHPMSIATNIVIGLVGTLHVYILVLEMFLWDKPAGLRAFGQTQAAAQATKVLAANQGLYNGFLAAGLFWGLWLGTAGFGVKVFFLGCVFVAGLYGAATASRKILFVQAAPAALGLALLLAS